MQKTILSRILRTSALGAAAATCLVVTGCGGFSTTPGATSVVSIPSMKGVVHGGQQPVSSAIIQLYAANLTGGYGSASTALLTSSVTSDANGNFSITGDYTCPTAKSLVYITAVGGNPGAGNNANLSLMSALGPCGNLTSSTTIQINELTTVASVYALAPFMSSYLAVGSSATNLVGLTNAFSTVNKLVNIGTGQAPGTTLPVGATEPVAELNSIADIIASCVNTNGTGGTSTVCGSLFAYTTPSGGTAPSETIGAALNIAKYPANNVSLLLGLSSAVSPFQPTISSANDFTVSLKYAPAGVFSSPSAAALDSSGNVWVTNAGTNSVAILDATTGVARLGTGSPALSSPSAIAFDMNGNAWVANKGNATLSVFTPAGVGSPTTATGLNKPSAIAIDGQNTLWVTNNGNSSLESVTVSGTSVVTSTGYSGSGISSPVGVAINPR